MYQLQNVEHSVVIVLKNGDMLNLINVCEQIGIEEPKNEVANRVNLTVRNVIYKDKLLISYMYMALDCYIYAFVNDIKTELFRGRVWKVNGDIIHYEKFTITCYDDSMYLNKAKTYALYAAGTDTKTIIKNQLDQVGISLGGYTGPQHTHEKLVYQKKSHAGIIKDVMDKCYAMTGVRCATYMKQGKYYVSAYGENDTVYRFTEQNAISGEYTETMLNLITRVLVLGKNGDPDEERRVIQTTSTGDVQYGIITDIVVNNDDTFDTAKGEADQIIANKGKVEQTISIKTVNIPTVHKGDVHYITIGAANGYAKIMGVSHDIKNMTMTMECEMNNY